MIVYVKFLFKVLIKQLPMQNIITPKEFQELINNKTVAAFIKKATMNPSKKSISIIMGYASALNVLKTKSIGNICLLLN